MMNQPQGVRRVVQTPNGPRTVFVDAQTGQQIQNPTGYKIQDTANTLSLQDLGISPTQPAPNSQPEHTIAQETIKQNTLGSDSGSGGIGGNSGATSRDASNNFGYADKPGVVSVAAAMPGMVGMAGKAASIGYNASNVAAVNEARGMLGLEDASFGQNAKGFLSDNKGIVAEVSIGKGQYAVGLNETTPTGRTTITPDEAMARSTFMGTPITEVSPEAKAKAESKFAEAFPDESKGLFSQAFSFVESLFSDPESKADPTGFPDAPAAPDQTGQGGPDYSGQASYSGQGKGYDSPAEGGPGPGMGIGAGPSNGPAGGTEAAGLW